MTVTASGAARTARGHISDSPNGGGGNLSFLSSHVFEIPSE